MLGIRGSGSAWTNISFECRQRHAAWPILFSVGGSGIITLLLSRPASGPASRLRGRVAPCSHSGSTVLHCSPQLCPRHRQRPLRGSFPGAPVPPRETAMARVPHAPERRERSSRNFRPSATPRLPPQGASQGPPFRGFHTSPSLRLRRGVQ